MSGFFEDFDRYLAKQGRREKYRPNPFDFGEIDTVKQFKKPKGRKSKKMETEYKNTRRDSSHKRGDTTHGTPGDMDTIESGSIHIKGNATPKSIHFPMSRDTSSELEKKDPISFLQKREPEIIRKSPIKEKNESEKVSAGVRTPCKSTVTKDNQKRRSSSTEKKPRGSGHTSRYGADSDSMRDFTPHKAYDPSSNITTDEVSELFDGIHRNLIPKLMNHTETRNLLESNYSVPMCYQDLLDCFHNIELALFTLISRKERPTYKKIRDWIFSQFRV